MHLSYYDKNDPEALQDAYSEAIACATANGHTLEIVRDICSQLKLNLLGLGQLGILLSNTKVQHHVMKVVEQAPLFPAIIIHSGHCSLATRKWGVKPFSIREVFNAFVQRRQNLESLKALGTVETTPAPPAQVTNAPAVALSKLRNKQERT